jgi:hypothetical protein
MRVSIHKMETIIKVRWQMECMVVMVVILYARMDTIYIQMRMKVTTLLDSSNRRRRYK